MLDDRHPGTAGGTAPLLDSDDDACRLPLPTLKLPDSPKVSMRTFNQFPVKLYFAVQRLTRHVDHGAPEFMEHHQGGLVAAQGHLTLKEAR